jgi:hypothetical protein
VSCVAGVVSRAPTRARASPAVATYCASEPPACPAPLTLMDRPLKTGPLRSVTCAALPFSDLGHRV